MSVSTCVSVHMSVECMSMNASVYTCLFTCACVSRSTCMYVNVYVHTSTSVCVSYWFGLSG